MRFLGGSEAKDLWVAASRALLFSSSVSVGIGVGVSIRWSFALLRLAANDFGSLHNRVQTGNLGYAAYLHLESCLIRRVGKGKTMCADGF